MNVIFDGLVAQSLNHDGFQKVNVPLEISLVDKRKSFLYRRDAMEFLCVQVNIAHDNYVMSTP